MIRTSGWSESSDMSATSSCWCTLTCVAARPMPGAAYMVSNMSAIGALECGVEHGHGLRLGAQARIGEFENGQEGHGKTMKCGQRRRVCKLCGGASLRRPALRGNSRPTSAAGSCLDSRAHVCDAVRFPLLKFRIHSAKSLGESGNWQPCLKNYLRFRPDCCSPSRCLPPPSNGPTSIPTATSCSKGDTLWAISARFLNKPWHWPEIWQDNPQVRNPHLIYPGDELVLAGQRIGHGSGSIGPHARVTSLDDAIKPIPLSELEAVPEATRASSAKTTSGTRRTWSASKKTSLRGTTGQLVYVRGLDAQPGQKLALVRTQRPLLRHAAGGRRRAARGAIGRSARPATVARPCCGGMVRSNSRCRARCVSSVTKCSISARSR